jgi:hypothetical protein
MNYSYSMPQTIEEWTAPGSPSAKMNALVVLVLHHLDRNGAPPLKSINGNVESCGDGLETANPIPNLPDDKIIIFGAFPSSNPIIVNVCGLVQPDSKYLISSRF